MNKHKLLKLCVLNAVIIGALHAQNDAISTLFDDGKPMLNVRLRYENADQDGLDESEALTIRTRLGFQTGTLNGFQGLVEMEDIRQINDSADANLDGSLPALTGIPDPEVTELNRAWVSYTQEQGTVKLGRERIKLDNDRFIGNVGWRQNEQTYDMVSFSSDYIENFNFFYSYVWQVQRVFGDESKPDFEGDIHILNGAYTFADWLKLSGFAYLMELETANNGNDYSGSNDTFGFRATGVHKYEDSDWKASYSASWATQSDNSASGADFDLDYYALEIKGHYDTLWLGAGLEVLEGDGTRNFATPLATVHAFNGWADSFLGDSVSGTGGAGVEDYYIAAGYTIPVCEGIGLKAFYHWFEPNEAGGDSGDFGNELDLVATYKINKHFSTLAKFADYEAGSHGGSPDDKQIFWLQLTFNY